MTTETPSLPNLISAQACMTELDKLGSDHDAAFLQRFFKTGKGEYGEGDIFIGVCVPMTRKVCNEFKALPLSEVRKLIESPIHEHRQAGLIILTLQYPKSDNKQAIYELYLDELDKGNINNWDLIDVTCTHIIGAQAQNNRAILYKLANNPNIWHRRTAIIATSRYIAKGDPSTTLDLLEITKTDSRDLIQKANGWMLREIGKRCDEQILRDFLDINAATLPRVMLRYAIERLPVTDRKMYLAMRKH